jgi:hypothetical protein
MHDPKVGEEQPEHILRSAMDQTFVCIIGAQRSGTTWLYQMLDGHPAITMAKPVRPEPKFFLDQERVLQGRCTYDHLYFPDIPAGQMRGEKGTSYIEHPEAAARILSFFPDAKAIAILRDPVRRAISNYWFSVKHGLETRTLREVFLDKLPEPRLSRPTSVPPFDYLGRGEYCKHLRPWANTFEQNFRIVIFEEISKEVARLQDLYEWIGVERGLTPVNYHEAVNRSDPHGHATIDTDVVAVLKEHFAPHILALENWIGKKISDWHDPL